jgi:glycosyltransferase involved in cell wall biosynthesis
LFNLGVGPDAVLYNPVDVPSQVPRFSTRNICKVVFTGTLTRKKGIISLFRAWPLVKKHFGEAELHVYGKDGVSPDGPGTMRDYLLKSLPEAMQKSTKFYGHVAREELINALSRARAAVFPSYSETFGLGPAEAMACACPTIYTTLTCGPEIIRDGVDGLLVDPDQPDQIAAAILKLLVENETASYLSEAGRKRVVQCFGLDRIVSANEAFFRATVQNFQGKRGVK